MISTFLWIIKNLFYLSPDFEIHSMGYKQFYRFVFALFLSLNVLVYLAKSGATPLYYFSAAVVTFSISYLFAMLMFKKIGWRKQEASR